MWLDPELSSGPCIITAERSVHGVAVKGDRMHKQGQELTFAERFELQRRVRNGETFEEAVWSVTAPCPGLGEGATPWSSGS